MMDKLFLQALEFGYSDFFIAADKNPSFRLHGEVFREKSFVCTEEDIKSSVRGSSIQNWRKSTANKVLPTFLIL